MNGNRRIAMRHILFTAFVTTTLLGGPLGGAYAQAPSAAALERSKAISSQINELFKKGDAEGARRASIEGSQAFAAQKEPWLAASYLVAAAEFDIRAGNAQRIEAETWPKMQELLKVLDTGDRSRGDMLVEVLMDAKGMLQQYDKQDELVTLYQERVAETSGQGSEPALLAGIRAGYSIIQGGRFDQGYKQLRDALIASARTDHYAFTLKQYAELAEKLLHNNMADKAGELFAEAEKTKAARADIKETADFYLAYAEFRRQVVDPNQHFVPLYTKATTLYDKFYGRESKELIHANDKLAAALAQYGQYGTAITLQQTNYDLALKALGKDDTITWRLANNLAESLRSLGSPARALELDKMVLANRTKYYGPNHFNTLVSANNTAQDYLELGDYKEALRLFGQTREIATATQDANNLPVANTWIEYTEYLSGARKLDDTGIAKMSQVVTSSDYPEILGVKAATLLADHYEKAGDLEKSLFYRNQAYHLAGETMSTTHPMTFAGQIALAKTKAVTDVDAAAADFATIHGTMLEWVSLQTVYATNRDLVETTRAMADDMLYDYAELAEKDPKIVEAFAEAARRWPSVTSNVIDDRFKLLRLIDPSDSATAATIKETIRSARIMTETFAGTQDQEAGYALLDKSRAADARLQTEMNERYPDVNADSMTRPLPTGKQLLEADQALVQYFITRKWKADRDLADPFVDTRLYAIVSRKDKEPTLHELGDPRAITSGAEVEQVALLRSTRSQQERGAMPLRAVEDAFSGLEKKLIAPLQTELAGVKTVFIIPDGKLFAVPFSMLPDSAGRALEERYTIRVLTRPESLYNVAADQKFEKGGQAVLAGGLDYGNGKERGADPLPGTLKEVQAIGDILKKDKFKVDILTGADVSEPALRKDMERAKIAHLATHGAYASPKTGGEQGVDALWQSDVILSRSGDKRSMKRDENDGRLYAFELMGWDLSKLDLLVLSACETGRGEETFVGGLRGLPTAINIAGAKRSLLTLWPVDDAGTAEFMVRFYENLTAGATYPEALRQTRLEAIGGKLPAAKDPRVWAAFVMFEN